MSRRGSIGYLWLALQTGILLWPTPFITGFSEYGKAGSSLSYDVREGMTLIQNRRHGSYLHSLLAQVDLLRPQPDAAAEPRPTSCPVTLPVSFCERLAQVKRPAVVELVHYGLTLSLCQTLCGSYRLCLRTSAFRVPSPGPGLPKADLPYALTSIPILPFPRCAIRCDHTTSNFLSMAGTISSTLTYVHMT